MTNHLIVDVATAPLPDVSQYLNDSIEAPSNYKNPEAIAKYIAEARAAQQERAALDPDLCRISAIGVIAPSEDADIALCKSEATEAAALRELGNRLWKQGINVGELVIVNFNGSRFDLPVLMRRAQYLNVPFPKLNLDRYRSPHIDLFNLLSMNGQLPSHSLGFYKARLGWIGVEKPLSGAEEARVFETGAWDDLEASVRHDLLMTRKLAEWCGVL